MKLTRTLSRWAGVAFIVLLAGCQTTQADPNAGQAAVNHALAGKAVWEEKCRSVAGEMIYRKVENVEGLLLMKVRPERGGRELADRMWPGAAFARESRADEYLTTFLGREHPLAVGDKVLPITPKYRGTIGTDKGIQGSLPGYRWVEVIDEKDGQRYRYTGSNRIVGRKDVTAPNVKLNVERDQNYDLNIYGWVLDKAPSPSPTPPRYGVTYEDHVIPEDRYLGIASSTIKVIDLESKEVLGEMTRYAWSGGAPSRDNPSPWLTAYRCPDQAWTGADTRKFVDQILIPAKEK